MICAPILALNVSEALALSRQAATLKADLVEIRLDYFTEPPELERLRQLPLPAIITCRARREGGRFAGAEEERLAILQKAIDLGFAYVDAEADCLTRLRRTSSATKLIASRHDFDGMPADLAALVRELETLPCDIIKFAGTAQNQSDNLKVFSALEKCRKPVIGLAMGELGEISRILGPSRGAYLTFGSLAKGSESAPGQLTVSELIELYRVNKITRQTRLYGVIGNPIAHSLSPEIHNTAFARLGLDAVYLRFRVFDFPDFLQNTAEPLGLLGISVTIPHKEAAAQAACEQDSLSQRLGVGNTLSRLSQGWSITNTDAAAALAAIRQGAERAGFALKGATALVIGAGGTARAVAFALQDAGCILTVANRTKARAEELAREIGGTACGLDEVKAGFKIIANTTSVGMHPKIGETPLSADLIAAGSVVFDAVYNPRQTRLLREARQRGAEIADGVQMFVGQATAQFELWTGRPAPREDMERIVGQRLS